MLKLEMIVKSKIHFMTKLDIKKSSIVLISLCMLIVMCGYFFVPRRNVENYAKAILSFEDIYGNGDDSNNDTNQQDNPTAKHPSDDASKEDDKDDEVEDKDNGQDRQTDEEDKFPDGDKIYEGQEDEHLLDSDSFTQPGTVKRSVKASAYFEIAITLVTVVGMCVTFMDFKTVKAKQKGKI